MLVRCRSLERSLGTEVVAWGFGEEWIIQEDTGGFVQKEACYKLAVTLGGQSLET